MMSSTNTINEEQQQQQQQQQPSKKGIVIVGCGQIMTHHVEQIAETGESYRVLALCDPNPKRRQVILECCRQHDVIDDSDNMMMEFDTLSDFLKQSQDNNNNIILIALPHDLHETVALEALASGNHVVLEKPLAPTLASCDVISEAAKTASGMLIVAEQSPYWEEILLAKSLIGAGQIGTVISAAAYYYESMRTNLTSGVDDADGGLGWRCSLKKAGGGIVIDGGLHWLRPLRELCGDVDSVVGVTRKNVQPGLNMEGETVAHALLKMKPSLENSLQQPIDAGPLVATYSCMMLHTAPMAHDMCPFFRITGTEGELVVSGTGLDPNGGGGLRLYNAENLDGTNMFAADRQGGFYLGFRGLWKEISRILREDDRVAAANSVDNAAKDVAVALALYESSRSGQWESV